MFEHSGKAAAMGVAVVAFFAVAPERPVGKAPFAAGTVLGFFVEMAVMMMNGSHICRSPLLST
jgi:hypothetical protein